MRKTGHKLRDIVERGRQEKEGEGPAIQFAALSFKSLEGLRTEGETGRGEGATVPSRDLPLPAEAEGNSTDRVKREARRRESNRKVNRVSPPLEIDLGLSAESGRALPRGNETDMEERGAAPPSLADKL